MSTTFIITSIMVILMPGPGFIYTVKAGINKGVKAGILVSFGCTLGILPHLFLGILSIAFLSWLPDFFFVILRYMGIAYLLYMGYNMIRSSSSDAFALETKEDSYLRLMLTAIPINLLNPKLTMFFLSFLPQFITASDISHIHQALLLSAVFMMLSQVLFTIYGFLSGCFCSWFNRILHQTKKRSIMMNRVFGIIFILFALDMMIRP